MTRACRFLVSRLVRYASIVDSSRGTQKDITHGVQILLTKETYILTTEKKCKILHVFSVSMPLTYKTRISKLHETNKGEKYGLRCCPALGKAQDFESRWLGLVDQRPQPVCDDFRSAHAKG